MPDIKPGGCRTQCLPCKGMNTGSTLALSSDSFARNQPHHLKHPSVPISILYKTLSPPQEGQTTGESFHSYSGSAPCCILGFSPVLALGPQAKGGRCGAGSDAGLEGTCSAQCGAELLTTPSKNWHLSSFPNLREAPPQKNTQHLCF